MVVFSKATHNLKLTVEEKEGLSNNKQQERKYNAVFPIYRKESATTTVIKFRKPIDRTLPRNEWNSTNTIEVSYSTFDGNGTPEDMVDTVIRYDELVAAMNLHNNPNDANVHQQRANIFEELMDGVAKTFFKQTFETETDENAARAAPD
jgi:hypothetical protein